MLNRIKIMHVLHAVGGVDVYLRLILENIDCDKFELIIVHGINDTKLPYFDKKGNEIKTYEIPIDRNINLKKDISSILYLKKIINKEKPDLIHGHSAKGGVISRVAALFTGVKVLYTPHAFSYLSAENKIKSMIYLTIEKLLKHTNSLILATSESEANRAVKEVKYSPSRVLTFKNSINPIDENLLAKVPEFDLPDKYICSVGRPSFQKNIETMVNVFNQLSKEDPELHLILLGVGLYSPNKTDVELLIKQYDLESKFIMIPWIERESIFPIIHKSKLYLSTSRYEGLPYSIIECLALGKACVVSDCDGNKDLIQNGINGYVISQSKMEEEMPVKISEILVDDELRNKFEENSLKLFFENYDITKTISLLEEIYSEHIN